MAISTWLARAIWTMLTVSIVAGLFLASANYAACRADGTDKVVCVFISLITSIVQAILFAIGTVIDLIIALLP
jgi:hypothetical protein